MRRNVISFIAFAWILVVSIIYFTGAPFGELAHGLPSVRRIALGGSFLSPCAIAFLLIISASGWGRLFLHLPSLSRLERFIFSTGIGIGIYCLMVLAFDSLGITTPVFYFLLILTGTVLFLLRSHASPRPFSPTERILLLIAALPAAGALIGALAPPTQFDSLVYHLSLPARYISDGRIFRIPSNFFVSFPQNGEMLFQIGLLLDGDILANLVSWSFLPLTTLAVYAFGRRFYGEAVGLTAAAFWIFTPHVLFLASGTYVDLMLAYFVILSLYSFALADESHPVAGIRYAAYFSAIAAGTKYTGLASTGIIAALIIVFWRNRAPLRPLVSYLLVFLVFFLPWLIKNILLLGNPIAPWAASFFSGSAIDPVQARGYFTHIQGHGIAVRSFIDMLLLPWNITFYGFRYGGAFDLPGPIFLLFLPALLLRDKIARITKIVFVFIAVFCAFWLAGGKVLRFLMPVFPFIAVIAAVGFQNVIARRYLRYPVFAVLALALLHNLIFFHWVMASVDPYAVVLSGEGRDHYLSRKLNYYPAVHRVLNLLPPNSKTLFWGETRSYYCTGTVLVPTVFDPHPLVEWANASSDPHELSLRLKEAHITHILVNNEEVKRLGVENQLTEKGAANWNGLKTANLRICYTDPYCQVSRIDY